MIRSVINPKHSLVRFMRPGCIAFADFLDRPAPRRICVVGRPIQHGIDRG
jgi:hypothetical protein